LPYVKSDHKGWIFSLRQGIGGKLGTAAYMFFNFPSRIADRKNYKKKEISVSIVSEYFTL
jgi:hypothetical protein